MELTASVQKFESSRQKFIFALAQLCDANPNLVEITSVAVVARRRSLAQTSTLQVVSKLTSSDLTVIARAQKCPEQHQPTDFRAVPDEFGHPYRPWLLVRDCLLRNGCSSTRSVLQCGCSRSMEQSCCCPGGPAVGAVSRRIESKYMAGEVANRPAAAFLNQSLVIHVLAAGTAMYTLYGSNEIFNQSVI